MEKERGFRIIAVIALMVAVVGLTIGYAAYSSTLRINGTANVDPSSWNVKFVYKTGNSLTYTFAGKNAGSLAAKLSTFTMGTLSCAPAAGSSATTEEASNVCKELSYTLTGVKENDTLAANASSDLTLKLEWSKTGVATASGPIAITVGETTLLYTQA